MGNTAMVMGDLVLLQTEVNPVMAKLIEGGVDVTAVHNHLLRSEPLTFYMHVGGHRGPLKIAETLPGAFAVGKKPPPPPPPRRSPLPRPPLSLLRSTSTPLRSSRSSALRAPTMAGFMRSTCPAATRSPSRVCRSARRSWAERPPSTSNRPAAARRRSPVTLHWLARRSSTSYGRYAPTAST